MELNFDNNLRGNRHYTSIAPVANESAGKDDALIVAKEADKKASVMDHSIRFMAKTMHTASTNSERLPGLFAQKDMDAYRSELTKHALDRHLVTKEMHALSASMSASSEPVNENMPSVNGERAKTASPAPETAGQLAGYNAIADAFSAATDDVLSSREICADLAKAIGIMSDSYLDIFQQAVEKNAAFYQDFSDFMSKLKNYIEASGDKTILKANAFREELQILMNKYPVPGQASTLFPAQTGGPLKGASKEECIAWAKEMGLNPDTCVRINGDGYIVHIDVSPLQKIQASVPSQDKMECNSAQWAAWQAGLDMQKDTIQTGMQTLTQKYSNANSTFDNLVKILSSTISSLLECDKAFFNI